MLISVLLSILLALWGRAPASNSAFFGYWWGHTRGLEIRRDGRGLEGVSDGCCHQVITLRFRLLRVLGTRARAVAAIKVASADVAEKAMAWLPHGPPHGGQVGTLVLQGGVLTDELTGVTFCAPTVNKCGA
jgi:hypothetical protein